MHLLPVPADKLEAAWPHIAPFAEKMAADSNGKVSAIGILSAGLSGAYRIWVVLGDDGNPVALVVLKIIQYERVKVCRFIGCVGIGRKRWAQMKSEIEEWAKADGCDYSVMECRKGWAREFPDYKLTHVILEKAL